ncbi:glycosyltransferase [Gluconobacter albidus]|uniref:glycosyltransferase n=1 Tax=Gluconobacter albidus TaxID=318683 RepID=UPI001B8BFD69|nr:glycosyltransferase [Gluconobacter albidus]MBS1028960.1 glycosyltransferase [Gluconobacter albidus]
MTRKLEKLAFGAALLPFVMTLLNLGRLRRLPDASGHGAISVLIPARDEEETIQGAIDTVLASSGVKLELIVLDDHSSDRTLDILRACDDPRLRVLQAPALPEGWCGKTHACAVLGEAARYGLMLFIDADVRLQPDALARLSALMSDQPDVSFLSGVPRQVTRTFLEWLLLPFIHVLLLGYLPMVFDTGRKPAFAAACGQLVLVRRRAYQASGGHAAVRNRLHDGLALARQFRRHGFRAMLFDATDLASCRMYRRGADVWNGLLKNATEGMATPRGLPVWSVLLGAAQILPFVLPATPVSRLAAGMTLLTRGLISYRFRQGWGTVVLAPLGTALLLLLQWQALIGRYLGYAPRWRGRSYPPGSV